jgi:hypothetical protein
VLEEWDFPETPGSAEAIDKIAKEVREKAADEAAALTGRIAMRITAEAVNGSVVSTMSYVLLGQSREDSEQVDDDSPATVAAALAASQRHAERFAQLAGSALAQAAEMNSQTMHALRTELAAYQARDSEMVEERFELINTLAKIMVGQAEAEAASIREEAEDKRKQELFKTAQMLGTSMLARVTGNEVAKHSALSGLFSTLSDEQKATIFGTLTDEQKAALFMLTQQTQS